MPVPNSWRASVAEARHRIARLVRRMPSLAPHPAQVLADGYLQSRTVAKEEIGVANLPESCPWTIEQVLDRDFCPDS